MIRFLLPLILIACQPAQADYYRVHNDHGGSMAHYTALLNRLTEQERPVKFSGFVYSGATLLVGVPGSCAEPGTTFGFHGASYEGRHDMLFSYRLATYYPPRLRTWFEAGPMWLHGEEIAELDASDLVSMGVLEFCGEN